MNLAGRILLLAQEHAEEGGDATRLVLPEIDELIWGAIAFSIVFFALSRIAFPRLRQGLQAREQAIRAELERAEQARVEAEQKREEYDRRIAEARDEADRIVKEATEAAEEVRRDRVARAEDEARQIVEKARGEAGQERDRAFTELQRQLVERFISSAGAGR